MRDLTAIGTKIVQVLNPTKESAVLRDWDLWGPLVVSCLLLFRQVPHADQCILRETVLLVVGGPPLYERYATASHRRHRKSLRLC